MSKRLSAFLAAVVFSALAPSVQAWDHPGHMATAGYRIADIILAATDRLETERNLAGRVLDAMQRHGPSN